MTLSRQLAAEAIGSALLLAIVVGSGIMGDRLAQGNAAVALRANSIATGAGLYALIVTLGPISGAHFNPIVSVVSVWQGTLTLRQCALYGVAQIGGAFVGVLLAHVMFSLPLLQVSAHIRPTAGEGLGEVIATFGLVLVLLLTVRFRKTRSPSRWLRLSPVLTGLHHPHRLLIQRSRSLARRRIPLPESRHRAYRFSSAVNCSGG